MALLLARGFMSMFTVKEAAVDDRQLQRKAVHLTKSEVYRLRKAHVADACILFYDPEPLQIVRAKGQYMYDEKGYSYLDCINNVSHVGHCHPAVVRAGQRQMELLNTNSRYLSEINALYAQRLIATFPAPLDTVFFLNSGSEATELALELCKVWTDATDFICVSRGYHGNTRNGHTVSSHKYAHPAGIGKPEHVQEMELPDTYRGAHRDTATAGVKYGSQAEDLVRKIQQRGARLAGFICESVVGCGGQLVLPPRYLETVYNTVRAAGGLCIADEVQVGFGRCGDGMWAYSTQNVIPDIVTLGKPMGNGHPIAAVVTSRAISQKYSRNRPEFFNTYGGNHVSMAIGLAVLDVIESENMVQHARVTGNMFMEELRCLQKRHTCIGDVRGLGLFIGVDIVRDRASREPDETTAVAVKKAMYATRVIVSTDGEFNNVLKIKPPMTFNEDNVRHFVRCLEECIIKVGLLHG